MAGLKIPGGGALRLNRGNSIKNALAENIPIASQSNKNAIQIVARLRMNPAATKFANPLFSISVAIKNGMSPVNLCISVTYFTRFYRNAAPFCGESQKL